MPSRDTNDLHPILRNAYYKAIDVYKVNYPNDPQPFVTCAFRSNDEQTKLYNTKPKVTNAKAGESPHNYKPALAFDIAFVGLNKKLDWNKELFGKFADILEVIEPRIEWGGAWKSFKDAPHFELNGWKSYKK
jgi:peptidoglycan L-alanyl-D-glutamate endopeptidase CwlK